MVVQGRHRWYSQSGFGRTTFLEIGHACECAYDKVGGGTMVSVCVLAVAMASCVTSRPFLVVDLPLAPHQPPPSFIFPKHTLGLKKHWFQQTWFRQWAWLHYDEANDVAYCHVCVSALNQKRMKASTGICFKGGFQTGNILLELKLPYSNITLSL